MSHLKSVTHTSESQRDFDRGASSSRKRSKLGDENIVNVEKKPKEKEGEFGDDRIKIFDKYKAYAFDIHYDDAKSATNTQGSRGSRGSRGSQGSKITQSSKITRLTKSKNGKFINTNHTYQIYHNYAHLSVTLM